MCTRPVRKAGVPLGIATRSRKPTQAAASAPSTPMAISQADPWVRKPGRPTIREAMSKTRPATHAPIGTVTRIGWNGCPYGPASAALTGCLACRRSSSTAMAHLR